MGWRVAVNRLMPCWNGTPFGVRAHAARAHPRGDLAGVYHSRLCVPLAADGVALGCYQLDTLTYAAAIATPDILDLASSRQGPECRLEAYAPCLSMAAMLRQGA
jgi:hypothetical protein